MPHPEAYPAVAGLGPQWRPDAANSYHISTDGSGVTGAGAASAAGAGAVGAGGVVRAVGAGASVAGDEDGFASMKSGKFSESSSVVNMFVTSPASFMGAVSFSRFMYSVPWLA